MLRRLLTLRWLVALVITLAGAAGMVRLGMWQLGRGEERHSIQNYSYEGFQPPLKQIEPDKIVSQGLVPESQKNIIITDEDFSLGVYELELAPAVNQMWQEIAQEVQGGA